MKHVSILVPKRNAILSSVVGPFKVLSVANSFLKKTGVREDNFFDIHFVGLRKETVLYDGAFSISLKDSMSKGSSHSPTSAGSLIKSYFTSIGNVGCRLYSKKKGENFVEKWILARCA